MVRRLTWDERARLREWILSQDGSFTAGDVVVKYKPELACPVIRRELDKMVQGKKVKVVGQRKLEGPGRPPELYEVVRVKP